MFKNTLGMIDKVDLHVACAVPQTGHQLFLALKGVRRQTEEALQSMAGTRQLILK